MRPRENNRSQSFFFFIEVHLIAVDHISMALFGNGRDPRREEAEKHLPPRVSPPINTTGQPRFQYVMFYDTSDDDNSQEAQISLISGAEQSSSSSSFRSNRHNDGERNEQELGERGRRGGEQRQRRPHHGPPFGAAVRQRIHQTRHWWNRMQRRVHDGVKKIRNENDSTAVPSLRNDGTRDPFEYFTNTSPSRRKGSEGRGEGTSSSVSPSLYTFPVDTYEEEGSESYTEESDLPVDRNEEFTYGSSFFRRRMQGNGEHVWRGQGGADVNDEEGCGRSINWEEEEWGEEEEAERGGWGSGERRMRGRRGGEELYGGGRVNEEGEEEESAVDEDLIETILQYQRSPHQFYLDIIQAKLKCDGVDVDGTLLSRAVGYPPIFQALLEYGKVDRMDSSVGELVQDEIDRILSGNPYDGDLIPSSELSYLRALCRIESSKVSKLQMVLLRYSGFSFIELLMDFPHLEENSNEEFKNSRKIRWCRYGFFIYRFFNRISCISTLLLNPAILATCIYWIVVGHEYNAYWTILSYFVGFMAGLITTIRSEQQKLQQYDRTANHIYYPDYYYAMFPIINIYKLVLWIRIIRYDRLPDKAHYVIIRHDLFRAHSIQQIAESIYSAVPQLILQTFLFSDLEAPYGKAGNACYGILLIIASLSTLFGVGSYTGFAVYSHSCDSFGFAIPLVDDYYSKYPHKMGSTSFPCFVTDILTRMIHFFMLLFCVSLSVTAIIDLTDSRSCSTNVIAVRTLVGISFGFAVLTIIGCVIIAAHCRFSRFMALLALPILLIYSITLILSSGDVLHEAACTSLEFWSVPWHPISVAFFGCTVIPFLGWAVLTAVELGRQRRITQRSLDYCLWKCK